MIPKWFHEHHAQERARQGLRTVKRAAKGQGRSLNAQIIQLLEAEAALLERRKGLPELIKKLDRFAASLPPMEECAPLIRQERQRR
jgi:hypothetical protein